MLSFLIFLQPLIRICLLFAIIPASSASAQEASGDFDSRKNVSLFQPCPPIQELFDIKHIPIIIVCRVPVVQVPCDTDSYFSLLHFVTGEEMVTDAEWKYFLDCLNGNRVYNLEEKLQMTDKNSIGGSV